MEIRIPSAADALNRARELANAASRRIEAEAPAVVAAVTTEANRVIADVRDQVQASGVLGQVSEVGEEVFERVGSGLSQARGAVAPVIDDMVAAATPYVAPALEQAGAAVAPLVARAGEALEPVIGPARREYAGMTAPLTISPMPPRPLDATVVDAAARIQGVDAGLARMSEPDRAAYRAVEARLRAPEPAAGRDERLRGLDALQQLALRDRLPGAADSAGRSVLANLAGLAAQPMAAGVDGGALLAQVVGGVENPARIHQGSFNSCGAGSSQQLFALTQPAEYVRVMAGLAAPEGRVATRGGVVLERHPNWDRDLATGNRDAAGALFQSSFMQAANLLGAVGFYQNQRSAGDVPFENSDGLTLPGGYVLPGVLPGNQARIISSLTGTYYQSQVGNGGTVLNTAVGGVGIETGNRVDPWRAATPERPVTVALNYGDGSNNSPHWLAVIGCENGMVTLLNPHGQREQIPEDQVRAHMIGATYPT